MTNAGHPPSLWYRARTQQWDWLETQRVGERGRPAGVPLGLLADVDYDRRIIKPLPGDLLLLYSDGISEATNPAGEELGRDRLLDISRSLDTSSAEAFGMQLTESLKNFREGAEPQDDQTIIVLRRNAVVS
jgi:phosphoserine phosphatase RsbU/P